MNSAQLIREFWSHIQAREWEAAHAFLTPEFTATWPHTGERFIGRDNFIAMNREYPEGWTLHILDIASTGDMAVSQVEILHDGERHHGASFFTLRDGLISAVTEYWVQHGAEKPPEWRQKFAAPENQ